MLGKILAYLHSSTSTHNVHQSSEVVLSFEKKSPFLNNNPGRRETLPLVSQAHFFSVVSERDSLAKELRDSNELVIGLAMLVAQQLYFKDNALETTDRIDLRDANAATRKQYMDRALYLGRGE